MLFMGTNSLLFDDGKSRIFIDPYLSRFRNLIGPAYVFKSYSPKRRKIRGILRSIGIRKVDAIALTHTHPDHALDAPYIAKRTGAKIIGSKSAGNIARGYGIAEDDIILAKGNEIIDAGNFSIEFIESKHQPFPLPLRPIGGLGEAIEKPLEMPARPIDFKEGGSYCIFIEHRQAKILACGSPGFCEGMFDNYQADVLVAPIGGLAMQSKKYNWKFFDEVIVKSGAKRVFLSHWDDFRIKLKKKQRFIRNSQKPAEWIIKRGEKLGIEISLLPMMEIIKLV